MHVRPIRSVNSQETHRFFVKIIESIRMNWFDNISKNNSLHVESGKKRPYKLVLVREGQEEKDFAPTNGIFVNAFSPAQALMIFWGKYSSIMRNYIESGFEFRCIIDFDEEKRRKEIQLAEKQKKQDQEEQIQNAWWQD